MTATYAILTFLAWLFGAALTAFLAARADAWGDGEGECWLNIFWPVTLPLMFIWWAGQIGGRR